MKHNYKSISLSKKCNSKDFITYRNLNTKIKTFNFISKNKNKNISLTQYSNKGSIQSSANLNQNYINSLTEIFENRKTINYNSSLSSENFHNKNYSNSLNKSNKNNSINKNVNMLKSYSNFEEKNKLIKNIRKNNKNLFCGLKENKKEFNNLKIKKFTKNSFILNTINNEKDYKNNNKIKINLKDIKSETLLTDTNTNIKSNYNKNLNQFNSPTHYKNKNKIKNNNQNKKYFGLLEKYKSKIKNDNNNNNHGNQNNIKKFIIKNIKQENNSNIFSTDNIKKNKINYYNKNNNKKYLIKNNKLTQNSTRSMSLNSAKSNQSLNNKKTKKIISLMINNNKKTGNLKQIIKKIKKNSNKVLINYNIENNNKNNDGVNQKYDKSTIDLEGNSIKEINVDESNSSLMEYLFSGKNEKKIIENNEKKDYFFDNKLENCNLDYIRNKMEKLKEKINK